MPPKNTPTIQDQYHSLEKVSARFDMQVRERVENGFIYECYLDLSNGVPEVGWRRFPIDPEIELR
jgi:hypothetical protein